jgi:acyl-CoA thioester hydrolase
MSEKPTEKRENYRHIMVIPTRWMDNDTYGHVNNVTYYAYFDTVVNAFLIAEGQMDIKRSPTIAVVVETMCRYHRSLTFPDVLDAGVRVPQIGNTSVRYEIGLFRRGEEEVAASGHFVHVFVDRQTRRPAPIPKAIRSALAKLMP